MQTTVVLMIISLISNFSYSQTMLNPVAHKLENTRYSGSPLSFDGYLKKNKAECTNRIASQMLKMSKEKNKDYIRYTKNIGTKLKQVDDRCHYFRFELIDYIEDGAIDMRFAYRCYATATGTLPHQRVSHIDPLVINPAIFYKDEDLVVEKCDALAITKQLSTRVANSMKGNSPAKKIEASENKAPSIKSKKSSTQN